MNITNIQYKHPKLDDGAEIYQLIVRCPPLDINSEYYYYIFCRDFGGTCVVATCDDKIIGFISSYIKPGDVSCLFIWQVAVLREVRQKKIASTMLRWLMQQPSCRQVTSLEVTFSPSNRASQSLFKHFAQEYGTNYQIATFLDSAQFHNRAHEEEMLMKISLLHQER